MFKNCYLYILFILLLAQPTFCGVVNPDISVIGQIIMQNTDDQSSQDKNKTKLNMGESEIQFDSYLNPYSRGIFVFSIDENGLSTEEAYLTIFKGLPDGFAFKGGKYRVGFGKLNPVHPHVYPFIVAPRVIGAMLPGDDGFNETGMEISYLLPTKGSWASTLYGDVINGSSFHPDETVSGAGWVGHWSNAVIVNDVTPLEIGISGAQGANNVLWDKKTSVYGVDVKTKIPFNALTRLTLQGEYFYNDSDVVIDSNTGTFNNIGRSGFYAFANLEFWQRYNAGIIYDQFQPRENQNATDRAVKGFLGYSLLEETTLLRLSYEQFIPEDAPLVHTAMFQVLFMMGPHKAHQF
jgi:hypothetical protein